MFDALYIGATGMQAQQLSVDTIAHNLANANTAGFKKGRVTFTDLMAQQAAAAQGAGGIGAEPGPLAISPAIGSGVAVSNVGKQFEMGELQQTSSQLDVAIRGDGFLEVALPDGGRAFTRGGTLKIGADGLLATEAGFPLKPGISVPANSTGIAIGADGRVLVTVTDQAQPVDAGRLDMVRFTNPGALQAQGDGLYRASEASGEPIAGRPGEDGDGTLAQGYVEGSNVKLVDEMVNLMVAQRAYEASVKVVQASDEMLGMVNGLRK